MKNSFKSLLTLVALASLVQVASANSITLTGTVRDFKRGDLPGGHPDFETFLGYDPGIVTNTLGVDGKPVYAGLAGNPTTTGAANFNQWFNNVAGVNQSTSYSITLNEITPGTYQYSNNSFFPINNQLWGNEGFGNNYHFTYELNTQFTYQSGQSFAFSGDDDVWVFIDKQLVIDLGGVHGTMSSSVNLNTLGLTAGNNYALDFFFAERHTSGSNFTMTTGGLQLVSTNVPDAGATFILLGMAVAGLGCFRRYRR
jgi:fibro-slime domain-containing protein